MRRFDYGWVVLGMAVLMGVAGGFVMVLFFSVWAYAFGRAHLGKIQGAAQLLTVVASAVGPLVLATVYERTGSYANVFFVLASAVALFALLSWRTPVTPFSDNDTRLRYRSATLASEGTVPRFVKVGL